MKKNVALFVVVFLAITSMLTSVPLTKVSANTQSTYYISPLGNDSNQGTETQPFKTIEKARDVVRTINGDMTGDIIVYLRGGTYALTDTLTFNEYDSGTNGYKVIYKNYPGEEPIVSGGAKITGWTQVSGTNLWSASVSVDNFRQLYVNGKRAQRARSETLNTGLGWYKGTYSDQDGIYVKDDVIGNYANASDIELVWCMNWKQYRHKVESILSGGTGEKIIKMQQPYYSWGTETANDGAYAFRPIYSNPFYIENAYELLDEPGEWYLNRSSDTVYYWPDGEDMTTAEVYVPDLETLIKIEGSSLNNKVQNITFEGISFMHGSWLRPSIKGFACQQAEVLSSRKGHQKSSDVDCDLVPGNIQVNFASNITLKGNKFEHMGAAALQLINGVSDMSITGNYFHDISDAAVLIGLLTHNYIDQPDEEVCKDITISNNLIRKIGEEFWSAPAINGFYTDTLQILHNDIADIPYSGVSLGWGWFLYTDSSTCRNNSISYNRISNFNNKCYDGGAIYTLGNQPNSTCTGNYIYNQHNLYAGIYHDEGSAYYTTTNNVVENSYDWLFLWHPSIHDITASNNYTTVDKYRNSGTNCSVSNTTVVSDMNWPQQAKSIISDAGLEESYYYLYAYLESNDENLAENKPVSAYYTDGSIATMYSGREAGKAVDGNPLTWAQASGEYKWILRVDLETIENISTVTVNFPNDPPCSQTLYATEYYTKTSEDGTNWSTAATVTGCTGGREETRFNPRPTRYVRIEAVKPDGPSQTGEQMAITELEVYAEKNLALGKPATGYYLDSSLASMQTGHEANYAVDGNVYTFAQAAGQYKWIEEIDLQLTNEISKVVVSFPVVENLYATEYYIKTSTDGTNWSIAATVTGCVGGRKETSFNPRMARYIRIEAIKPDGPSQEGGQMAITELEVYNTETKSAILTLDKGKLSPPGGGKVLWLKADIGVTRDSNGYVNNWTGLALFKYGLFGNDVSRNASQSNFENRPKLIYNAINGKPALRFDGVNDYLEAKDVIGVMNTFTVAFVIKPAANTDYNNTVGAVGSWGQFQFHGSADGGVYVGTDIATRISPTDGPGSGTIAEDTVQQFVYVFDNGNAKLYKNGILLANKTQTSPASWTGFKIGNDNSTTINGDVPEMIVYDCALSDLEIQQLNTYFKDEYGF